MESNYSKAVRLAGVLKRYSEDDYTVKQLTQLLNYATSNDLKKDMQAVLDFIYELDNK